MVLSEYFEQRKVEATFGSFASRVPLRTPSGPQWTESELETELLEQLAFAPGVYDIITQPIIRYNLDGEPRRYTPDIALQLHATGDEPATRFIIEVKREKDLASNPEQHRTRFLVGRLAANEMGAAFRIMTERQIRTPYLRNARLLSPHLSNAMEDATLDAVSLLETESPTTVSWAIDRLNAAGYSEPDARHAIEQAVARRLLSSDLSRPFNDESPLGKSPLGALTDPRNDPIMRLLWDADSE